MRSLLLLLTVCCLAPSVFAEPSKRDYLERIKKINTTISQQVTSVDAKVQKELTSPLFVDTEQKAAYNAQIQNVDRLLRELRELKLRGDFWTRVSFQVDSYYKNGSMDDFLSQKLQHMAYVQAVSSDNETSMWKFMRYLSDALKKPTKDPKDDTIAFIEGFMDKSPISDPLTPSEFNNRRDYSNGVMNKSAHGVSKEDLGEVVEAKLGPAADGL